MIIRFAIFFLIFFSFYSSTAISMNDEENSFKSKHGLVSVNSDSSISKSDVNTSAALGDISPKVNGSANSMANKSMTNLSSLSHWPLVVITLIGMVLLILVLAWSARRFGGSSFSRNKDMHIISSLALGTRERVALIDVRGQKLLLGITAQNVNHLYTFDELSDESVEPQVLENEFSNKLKNIMQSVKKVKNTDNESQ